MKQLNRIFASESAGGIVLMLAAVLAMVAANTGAAPLYGQFVGATHLAINDFLMAIFFLFAGLEIKRELKVGALASRANAMLPLIAAACGMVIPAIVYLSFSEPQYNHGWAIPAATDIAFALGVLALLGNCVPASLKVLLMAIAVIDDLGAILVIVFFYTGGIYMPALAVAVAATLILIALNRRGVLSYIPYIAMGLVLWTALLKAGIHPTIGGVILGFCIPMPKVEKWEHTIAPWVTFAILPLFGFANAGVSLVGMVPHDMLHPVTLGIALGLCLGKPVGIFAAIYMCVKTRLCSLAPDVTWRHIVGLGLMCGIGFTMALFIGALAFDDPAMAVYVRMGVIGGSILSALLGYTMLIFARGSRTLKGL